MNEEKNVSCGVIIESLERLSPPVFAESWDNVGLLAGRRDKTVGKVCVALDATDGVVEEAAAEEPDITSYTHTFKNPFTYQDHTYETLTFNWGALTGNDHLEIESELLMRGKTLVSPEFSGDFLCRMAVRACTERNADGFRTVSADTLKAMPMREYKALLGKARGFLLR